MMKNVIVTCCLTLFSLCVNSQTGGQLLAEKAARYYNLMEIYKGSPNLSMYLANRYFQKAGELGLAEAYVFSSKLNEQGYYVSTLDYSEDLKQKAEDGNSEDLYAIAQCYQFGWGIDKDVNQAKKYYIDYLNSIDGNNMSDNEYNGFLSACLLVQCIHIYEYTYLHIDKSIIDAVKEYGKEELYSPAQLEYGLLMVNEKNKSKSYKKGVKALEEAAQMGNHAAKAIVYAIYKEGLYGQDANPELADYWYNEFMKDNE